jgi:hypothetical protein
MLIVADGAPGLIKAIEHCWPASDRQHCAVHRVRNLLAKVPERERARVRQAYWQALDEATGERDAKQRRQALVGELDRAGYTAAARCLADDLDALVVHLRYPTRHRRRVEIDEPARALSGRRQTPHQGHRPLPRRDQLPDARLGRPRPLHQPRHQRHQVHRARAPEPQANETRKLRPEHRRGGDRRLDFTTTGNLSRDEVTAAHGRDPATVR